MATVYRLFVEKKPGFDIEAQNLLKDVGRYLGIGCLTGVRLFTRYDVSGLRREELDKAIWTVFAEANVDRVYLETLAGEELPRVLAVEYLPGQFDQRADSAAQCIQILTQNERPKVRTAKVMGLYGDLSDNDVARIADYYINPVESRLADLDKPSELDLAAEEPGDVPVITGFTMWTREELENWREGEGLAMSTADALFCQSYFRDEERRDPTLTELKVIDTYWSDHCRHTTFLTELVAVEIAPGPLSGALQGALDKYYELRQEVYGGNGQWGEDNGQWTEGNGQWTMDNGQWGEGNGQWTMDNGQWGEDNGQWTMDNGQWGDKGQGNDGDQENKRECVSDGSGENEDMLPIVHCPLSIVHCISLMDMAVIGQKAMKKRGLLADLDESEEINACSIVVPVDVDDRSEPWLVQFKNETHNHPTEIEPFGGAATCLGGAIRDPLSGRAYVYQAMRVTGSADPRLPLNETLPGKLPQHKITTGAARGYSSYGNQIGLATGQVAELYHPGYVAKRMEIGAVIGAVPQSQVRRGRPVPGDVVVLLGGRTGRDGCGGATGSSKAHDAGSLMACGAEVQKGDPTTERKIQRLFRKGDVSRLVKKCNDFGAGGVSVAIGELAEGLEIDLDRIPRKYQGLDGTELAVSESQERMAVVLDADDVAAFVAAADRENLEATPVARVSAARRLAMSWRGKGIVDLSRRFLDTNGVRQQASALIVSPDPARNYRRLVPEVCEGESWSEAWRNNLGRLEVAGQKGLVDMFDSTVGAGSVLMPFGGLWQLTPEEAMVAKIPLEEGETETTTIMSYGFMPALSTWSPCHGSAFAVVEALAKVTAVGGNPWQARLTLQEYFERLGTDRKRWGKPTAALLGALLAQLELGVPAIGGKDSMSGSFGSLDVPPTLVCFAVVPGRSGETVSAAFKKAGHPVLFWPLPVDAATELPDWPRLRRMLTTIHQWCRAGKVAAASVVKEGGLAAALTRMALGNWLGVALEKDAGCWTRETLFAPLVGSMVLEMTEGFDTVDMEAVYQEAADQEAADQEAADLEEDDPAAWMATGRPECFKIGVTQERPYVDLPWFPESRTSNPEPVSGSLSLSDLAACWLQPLEGVFPTKASEAMGKGQGTRDNGQWSRDTGQGDMRELELELPFYAQRQEFSPVAVNRGAKPRVLIPAFPGTNGETDMARAFARSGAETDVVVVRNLTGEHVEQSVRILLEVMDRAQMIAFPGGFSGGDEPDGSGKFMAALFRHEGLRAGLARFLEERDGLIIGICNGFQALIKLGLLPGGRVVEIDENHPTLTFNSVGHHISRMAYTRVVSVKSPWLRFCEVGQRHAVPVSHGEGRFVALNSQLQELVRDGQVVAQYVDVEGRPSMDDPWNPNGSVLAVEAICSPNGRILGKMGHSERTGPGLGVNVPGDQNQRLFEAGVSFFC
ncbi:MAG: phosphoribosylformylglycinamidine synthase [Peptococcaceae bacterium]|nr:phosphoribosylformylglycinamidine synthase [Peptococcaceae bacterium]